MGRAERAGWLGWEIRKREEVTRVMGPKALVIGGSGYIGERLATFLRERTSRVYGTFFRNEKNPSSRWLPLDVRDGPMVRDVLERVRPDIIFYLSCDMNDLEGTVLKGMGNVLGARRGSCPGSRLIFLSTDMVFDGERAPYAETDEPSPITEYGRKKREAELMALEEAAVVVRSSLVYGFEPMDPKTSILLSGLKTGLFQYPYFRDEVRSPIFVEDLCKCLVELALLSEAPRILHLGGPEAMSRYELARRIAEGLGFDSSLVPSAMQGDHSVTRPRDLTLDISLALKILRTRPRSLDRVLSQNP
jgi:dTDP-4-dehydrorhamnose reductase